MESHANALDLRSRPLRVYGDDSDIYYYEGAGKKRRIKSALKKPQVQKLLMKSPNQIKLKPRGVIAKIERPRFKSALNTQTKELPNKSELKDSDDLDFFAKKKKDKEKLAELRKKIENGISLSKEEERIFPLLVSSVGAEEEDLYEEKDKPRLNPIAPDPIPIGLAGSRTKAQANRASAFETAIKNTGVKLSDIKAFDKWNGPNNGNSNALNQFAAFIRVLHSLPEAELDNIIRAVADNHPVTYRINIYPTDTKLKKIKKIVYGLTPSEYDRIIDNPTLNWLSVLYNLRSFPNPGQLGLGSELPALYNDEIEDFFSNEKLYPNFGGVIAADQIKELPKKLPIGFIMNLDESNEPGSHWVAVYISGDSVEYYDPLAQPPSESFKKDIKKYLESMKVPTLMKFKINKVADQHGNSHKCGYHSIRFLDDRFRGVPFKNTTRFENNSKEGEEKINKEFQYI